MAHTSNLLTHWVGKAKKDDADEQYRILTQEILKKRRLLYSRCPWHFNTPVVEHEGLQDYTIPMICFTDTPLSQCDKLCERYSRFGLSFRKRYLAERQANPVAYVTNQSTHLIWAVMYLQLVNFKLRAEKTGDQHDVEVAGKAEELLTYLKRMSAFFQDYSPKSSFRADSEDSFSESYEDHDAFYFEREWRMVIASEHLPSSSVKDNGNIFFRFDPQHLGPIIIPRAFCKRLEAERDDIFGEYDCIPPPVLAFEDLQFM